MVEIKLTITKIEGSEMGIITVMRSDIPEPKEMGKIKFSDQTEMRWLMMILTELHPYVSVEGECFTNDRSLTDMFSKCCSH